MWKAATRGATGGSSPVPGAIAGVAILALLAMKVKGKRKSPEAPPAPTPRAAPLSVPQKQPPLELPIVQNSRITREPQPSPPIMKPAPEPKPSALPFIDDEPFYEEVAREFESDSMKPGLWTKALAEADGDQERVKSIYIRLRVAQLLAAKEAELREFERLEKQGILDRERARQAEIIEQERIASEPTRRTISSASPLLVPSPVTSPSPS